MLDARFAPSSGEFFPSVLCDGRGGLHPGDHRTRHGNLRCPLVACMVGENANVKRFTTNVALIVVKRGLTIPVSAEPED